MCVCVSVCVWVGVFFRSLRDVIRDVVVLKGLQLGLYIRGSVGHCKETGPRHHDKMTQSQRELSLGSGESVSHCLGGKAK